MRISVISILILLIFSSCDEIPSGVVENNFKGVRVTNLSLTDPYKAGNNSFFTARAKFNLKSNIDSVWFNILWPATNKAFVEKIHMVDTGQKSKYGDDTENDNIYSGKTNQLNNLSSGRYKIEIITKDFSGNKKNVAMKYFDLTASFVNQVPVISDLTASKDTVITDEQFTITVKVTDPNGLSDIDNVLMFLEDPDGKNVFQNGFAMDDSGNSSKGDQVAGDGIYSVKQSFKSIVPRGTWKFTFKAVDKSKAESNVLTHNMVVK